MKNRGLNLLFKRTSAAVLSAAMTVTMVPVMSGPVYAATAAFANVGGGCEVIYANISGVKDEDVTAVSYEGAMTGSLTGDDLTYLVRDDDNTVRIDIPGLKEGEYTLNVTTKNDTLTKSGIKVEKYDRSGFAHFKYTAGVGAYKDDGTIKSKTAVVYVTDANKNDVTLVYDKAAKTATVDYTGTAVTNGNIIAVKGIGNILNSVGQKCTESGHLDECRKVDGTKVYYAKGNDNQGILKILATDNIPLDIRCIDMISDSGLYERGSFAAKPYGLIEGLTAYGVTAPGNLCDYGGTSGDNGHMARMKSGKDITIEGIGTDAGLDGWGIHFMCESAAKDLGKSFEVRNLTFINQPEDAIGMEGVQSTAKASAEITASVERCWVHNNEFYCPNITDPAESDKSEGDGSVDFKRGNYFTCSYNYFEDCHKTNLVGSADTSLQFNLSYHHNYWNRCKARGPLTRRANAHMYNNLIFGQTDYAMNTRAEAYIFSESNLFYACKSPQAVEAGAIKSYNDSIGSYLSAKGSLGTAVTSRSANVPNNCQYEFGKINYSKFDTDKKLSYCADVEDFYIQEDLDEMRQVIAARTGVLKSYGAVDPKSIPLSDERISVFKKFKITPKKVILPVEEKPGKVSKTIYAFTTDSAVNIDVTMDAASSTPGVLIDEAGVCYGVIQPGESFSLKNMPAGSYGIQPLTFQPGDAKKNTLLVFKDTTVASIKLTKGEEGVDRNKLTGITLDKSSVIMVAGTKASVKASLVPARANVGENKVIWASNNESVVKVDENGQLTAVANGNAEIKASITNGTDTYEAQCNVSVTEPKPLNGVTLDTTNITLIEGDKVDINHTVLPADTTDQTEVVYSSEDDKVASVDDNGNITAEAEGTTNIVVTVRKLAPEADGTYTAFSAKCAVKVEKAPVIPLPEGAKVHNFDEKADGLKSDSFFTLSGKSNKKSSTGTYNGISFANGLKMESSTNVSFTASADGELIIVTDAAAAKIDVNGNPKETGADKTVKLSVNKGKVEITKNTASLGVFYVVYIPNSAGDSSTDKPVTAVTINKTTATMTTGASETLKASVNDDTTYSKSINWTSSDPEIATVKGGVVTAYKSGKVTITATSVADSTKSAECVITVTGSEVERPADESQKGDYIPDKDDSSDEGSGSDDGVEDDSVTKKYSFVTTDYYSKIGAFTNNDKYGKLDTGGGLAVFYDKEKDIPIESDVFKIKIWKIPSKNKSTIALIRTAADGKIDTETTGSVEVAVPANLKDVVFTAKINSSGSAKKTDVILTTSNGTLVAEKTGKKRVDGSDAVDFVYENIEAGQTYTLSYPSDSANDGEIRIWSLELTGTEKSEGGEEKPSGTPVPTVPGGNSSTTVPTPSTGAGTTAPTPSTEAGTTAPTPVPAEPVDILTNDMIASLFVGGEKGDIKKTADNFVDFDNKYIKIHCATENNEGKSGVGVAGTYVDKDKYLNMQGSIITDDINNAQSPYFIIKVSGPSKVVIRALAGGSQGSRTFIALDENMKNAGESEATDNKTVKDVVIELAEAGKYYIGCKGGGSRIDSVKATNAIELNVEIPSTVPTTPAGSEATAAPTTPAGSEATAAPTSPAGSEATAAPTTPAGSEATAAPTSPAGSEATAVPTSPAGSEATAAPTSPAGSEATAAPTTPAGSEATAAPTSPAGSEATAAPTSPAGSEATAAPTTPAGSEATAAPTTPAGSEATAAPTTPAGSEATAAPTSPAAEDGTPVPTQTVIPTNTVSATKVPAAVSSNTVEITKKTAPKISGLVGQDIQVNYSGIKNDKIICTGKNCEYNSETGKISISGKGTIKVYYQINNKKYLITKIKVVEPKLKKSLKLKTGKTKALKFKVSKEFGTVKWSSSDNKIATVKNGVVTAVSAGNAVIKAEVMGLSYECQVTVK